MEQQKLEQRVENIFKRQGFEVKKDGNRIIAEKTGVTKRIQAFSSEEYSVEDLRDAVDQDSLVFVDQDLENVKDGIENEVSVIRSEREEPDYDLPSYELIGNIAVINELTSDENETVEGILEYHPQVKTILLKEEPLSGEFRVGEYRVLYGGETETIHREFGCRYMVDPTKTYFSERLGTERERVIDQIEDGEHVLVIGAGVGPYPILAARKADPERVVAIEKNPEAFEYLEENIELNNVSDTVEAIKADARELDLDGNFDRIVIAVPEFADKFLETAFDHLAEGGVIHYYRFREDEDWSPLIEEIEDVAGKLNINYEIFNKTVCGDRGPSVDRVCIDLESSE